ncbi:MAG: DNA polymerase I [Eubacteriales bacterium]|jgi:DNA polymerase-1|nr:DNA polymerase I [Eubacteriales bacterium]
MEKLMIIDGNSIVNRAFYGIRLLTNSEGLYTNAIYGFLNILFKYLEEENPDYLTVAFDLPGPTFRHEQFKEYKANRKGMPDELAQQMPILKEVLSAMNIDMLSLEGYEADDIIGTVSTICENENKGCIILTGDKDDLQLASDKTIIKLVTTKGGSSQTVDYNHRTVIEKYGVSPEEFIDVKALMGDASDNIPGVLGIGEKTALSLIKAFGSIENLYKNIDSPEIKKGVREKLINGKENAFLSKALATINRQVPISFSFDECKRGEYDTDRLLTLFKKLNFNNLIQKLELAKRPSEQMEFSFAGGEGTEDVKAEIKKSGIMYYYITGKEIAVAASEEKAAVVPYPTDEFDDVFSDEKIKKISHDIKKDLIAGVKINNIYFDTLVAAYIITPSRSSYEIGELTVEYLGYSTSGGAAEAIMSIIALYKYLSSQIEQNGQQKLFYEVEMPLISVLADMQMAGVMVDRNMLEEFSRMLKERIDKLTEQIYEYAGVQFNINSPKQLGEVLFEKLRLPVIKKTKTGYSTNIEVLERLKDIHPIIDSIMEYRQLVKLKGTYADGLLTVIDKNTGKIHSNFNQTVAATGRISSTEPNLQNIPIRTELGREIRKMFVAAGEDNVLVDADYSQIELRVLAHISNDENMLAAFKKGIDIHTQTASQVFGASLEEVTQEMRARAKAVNFGIVYGMGDFSLSQDLGITRKEAKRYIDSYLATFGGVKKYMTDIVEKGKADGYVTTLLGRRRYLPELQTGNFITRSHGERMALNTPIQGTAADIIKVAMVRVHRRLKSEGLKSKLILTVHDELIVEAPKSEVETVKDILKSEMESALELSVPLKVDISVGKTWYEAK